MRAASFEAIERIVGHQYQQALAELTGLQVSAPTVPAIDGAG
jgi:hypothetical protein